MKLLPLLFLVACGSPAPPPTTRCEPAPVVAETPPAPVVEEEEPPPAAQIAVGECETDWLPAGTALDLTPEEREEVAALVRGWLEGDVSQTPLIEMRKGIAFAKSEDDEGADPPYPTTSAAAQRRACGLDAVWLRDHVRATFASAAAPNSLGVTCDGNVCCVPGMEYLSDQAIVLRRVTLNDQPAWAIDAAYEVAEATLGEEYVSANRGYVGRALQALSRSQCRGEPEGFR